ncbi:hypothetical protein [Pseudomonas syringae]|uniref:hypothetical protein n=1 Tax=Pseudomonas syringae TaxID=317 RepID=UPI001F0F4AEC|nr:hypothetical protein [Pseudomonas syringae]MCH5583109.1 hypothetical protein [Pseudomonas syringae pv. syringae]MCH5592792.1 hypothetical protein [Pseudomonas syringae pv. syringae]MDF5791043.1 hypothetical protein [Pseudomonas syringae pv. syringae]
MASDYGSTTSQLFSNASRAISLASGSAGRITASSKPNLTNVSLSYTANTQALSYSGNSPTFSYSPGSITAGEAPKFSDLFEGADNSNALISELNNTVDQWFAKYFPSINGSFKNITEDWCASIIGGTKPFGVDSTIFELVWQKARDRAYRTATSEQRQIEASFSSRGFSLPAGALADAISQSEQAATSAVLDVSRDQAIKDADIKADLLKHATTIASQLKLGILSASADYFRAIYAVHGTAIEKARIQAQLYSAYYSALSSYANVEVSIEQLRLRAAQAQAEVALSGEDLKLRAAQAGAGVNLNSEQLKLQAAEAKANVAISSDRNRVSLFGSDGQPAAHAQAARGFADAAAAAYSAAGSLTAQIESV